MILPLIGSLIFLLPVSSNALEFEAGLAHSRQPLYINIDPVKYPDQYDNRTIGRFSLSHTFNVVENLGVKLWVEHNSLAFEKEPSQVDGGTGSGLDMLGASVTYKFF